MEIEAGDILICIVEKIVGTTVFVEIEGTDKRGTIILSEISAGRIRNLRDYVVPKKTIVCKVLRVMKDHIELSLRRVNQKEQKEALEKVKLEKSYKKILKSVLKEKTKEIISKIKEKSSIQEFLMEAKEEPSNLKKIAGKENSEKILEILKKQKEKKSSAKKTIRLISSDSQGIEIIKKIFSKNKELSIKYLAAGTYSIKSEGKNPKEADQKIKDFINEIEEKSRKENIEFLSE